MDRKSVSILGATGSIGDSTLDIVENHPELFEVVALTGGGNVQKLAEIALKVRPRFVAIADETKVAELRERLADMPCEVAGGTEGVCAAAEVPCDLTVSAIVGFAGLAPTLAALDACGTLALANKESLVCAGGLVREKAEKNGVTILPLDSEHNAIFQALGNDRMADVEKITLTASGGPFRTWAQSDIAAAGPEHALKHPNWSMGAKITIDSATLMNKGLEVIEAHHLFPVALDQLSVVVHPQSIIHGMVSFIDGAVIAELGIPDMRTPIAHCMAHPNRISTRVERLDLAKIGNLTFEAPDFERFPNLALALSALADGDCATNLLNGANEVAVQAFLHKRIGFYDISGVVESVLADGNGAFSGHNGFTCFDDAADVDQFARKRAEERIALV
ncbi:MAG: 1-deoxy-D-xylulose-5-phosphate reductoisomerase [Pseudomonadota bacterium]